MSRVGEVDSYEPEEVRCTNCGRVVGYTDLVLNEVWCRRCFRQDKLLAEYRDATEPE